MCSFASAISVVAAFFSFGVVLSANTGSPDFSGVWELNAEKSNLADGRLVTITIEKVGTKIKWTRSDRAKDGKQVVSEFVCEAGASECDLVEGDHKAKVTLWFNGAALVILKTDGVKEDASTELTLTMSNDKKVVTGAVEHIEPAGSPETLVFDKKTTQ